MKSIKEPLYYFSIFFILFIILIVFYLFNQHSYNIYIKLHKITNNYIEEFISGNN